MPLCRGELDEFFTSIENGTEFRPALEKVLLDLTPDKSDRFMLLLIEGRGAWHPWTRVAKGLALWCGNAFSGGWISLAQSGFEVHVLDPDPERARFAHARLASQPSTRAVIRIGGDAEKLPFPDGSFDLVVQEEGLPGSEEARFGHSIAECLRVTRGECFYTVENRFAYKHSTGQRGKFVVPSPFEWLRDALAPKPGRSSLKAHERSLSSAGFESARSRALYPHMRDFTHVVDLDGKPPYLPIGPLERKNRIKIAGQSVGLFPVLTPSFVCGSARLDGEVPRTTRVDAALEFLAREIGTDVPEIENWTATRGNCAVLLTDSNSPEARWAIHIPMNEKERRELVAHDEFLRLLAEQFPEFPAPRSLFLGEIDGLWLACETRLDGIAATQVSKNPACAARLLDDTARHLASLVMEEKRPLTREDLDRFVGTRFDRVAAKAHLPETIAHVQRAREDAYSRLEGLAVPRVFYHADIRSKHVRVQRDGTVLGYLDFGCSSTHDLPYFDLVNLVVHENKRPGEFPSTNAWNRLLERREFQAHESQCLEDYAKALDLPSEYCRVIEEIYPILVVAMCELNWDCSRPRWLHEHFGY